MRKILSCLLVCSVLLFSCSKRPTTYFNVAALNCNLLYGFAGYEIERDLSAPQQILVDEKTMKMAPITRAEVVKDKLARAEENYQKVKSLATNADANEMVNASAALYEFVIPVYKNEYMQLAALYDGNAPAEKIAAAEKGITEKYEVKFMELYNAVIRTGTAYAERNGIPVKQVNPSPSN